MQLFIATLSPVIAMDHLSLLNVLVPAVTSFVHNLLVLMGNAMSVIKKRYYNYMHHGNTRHQLAIISKVSINCENNNYFCR